MGTFSTHIEETNSSRHLKDLKMLSCVVAYTFTIPKAQ